MSLKSPQSPQSPQSSQSLKSLRLPYLLSRWLGVVARWRSGGVARRPAICIDRLPRNSHWSRLRYRLVTSEVPLARPCKVAQPDPTQHVPVWSDRVWSQVRSGQVRSVKLVLVRSQVKTVRRPRQGARRSDVCMYSPDVRCHCRWRLESGDCEDYSSR